MKRNVKLIVDIAGQKEFRNEFDVVAIRGQTINIFECKTGSLDRLIIDRLRLIKTLSGTYSKIFLVTLYNPAEKSILERIKDFNITLIALDQLDSFLSNLQKSNQLNPNL